MSLANLDPSDGWPSSTGGSPPVGVLAAAKADVDASRARDLAFVLALVPPRGTTLAALAAAVVREGGIGWRGVAIPLVRDLLADGQLCTVDGLLFRPPTPAEWGAWCRATRIARGMSQAELARRVGYSGPTLSVFENARAPATTGNWREVRACVERVLGPYAPTQIADPASAQPSPPASVAESSEEEPATPPAAESTTVPMVAVVDQEARGRTATAGAVAAAGAHEAPSDSPGGPGVPSARAVAEPPAVGGAGRPAGGAAQLEGPAAAGLPSGVEPSPRGSASSAPSRTGQPESGEVSSPPAAEPVHPAAGPAEEPSAAATAGVTRQQGGSGGQAQAVPLICPPSTGAVDLVEPPHGGPVGETPVADRPGGPGVPSEGAPSDPSTGSDPSERGWTGSLGEDADREAELGRLLLVPPEEMADLEARAAAGDAATERAERAERALAEEQRFVAAVLRLLDRAERFHVRRDDDRWQRLGALGTLIDRLAARAEGGGR